MRDHQHGQVVFGAELADHVEHLAAQFRVERRGDFVEQHHFGTHGQCPRDRHPLLLAAGQLRRVMPQFAAQSHQFQQVRGSFAGLYRFHPEHLHGRLDDVLQRGHVREQVEALEHHADLAAHTADVPVIGRYQHAVAIGHVRQQIVFDADQSVIDAFEGHQYPQQRGFPRAARADDRDFFAGCDVQVQVIEHREIAVAFGDVLEADNRLDRFRWVHGRGLLRMQRRQVAAPGKVVGGREWRSH
ncbi:hypothetical protein D3C85_1267970 [compost metagenome]